jgi:hypothetical protein
MSAGAVSRNESPIGVKGISIDDVWVDPFIESFICHNGYTLNEVEKEKVLMHFSMRPHGEILMAMAIVESDLNAKDKTANNYGLLQLSDVHLNKSEIARLERNSELQRQSLKTVCDIGAVSDLYDVDKNLCGAAYLLSYYYRMQGDIVKAIELYNASPHKDRYARKVVNTYLKYIEYSGKTPAYTFNLRGK